MDSDILGRVVFTAPVRRRLLGWSIANLLVCLALCVLASQFRETLDRWDQVLQIGPQ